MRLNLRVILVAQGCAMFLKRIKAKDGKKRTYWALVKSVRTARGPRHRVVSYLGELQAGEKTEWANLDSLVKTSVVFWLFGA